MEIVPFTGSLLKRRWRRPRGYNRFSSTNKRNTRIVRFGSRDNSSSKRSWRLRLTRKLRLVRLASPLKLWYRFKNAYMKMMLRLADTLKTSDAANVFGSKRIPKARDVPMAYSRTEFENRLVREMYKSMAASLELGYNK